MQALSHERSCLSCLWMSERLSLQSFHFARSDPYRKQYVPLCIFFCWRETFQVIFLPLMTSDFYIVVVEWWGDTQRIMSFRVTKPYLGIADQGPRLLIPQKDTAQSLSRFPGTLFLCNTQKWKGGLGTSFSGRPNTQRSRASSDFDKHQKVDRYILPVKNVVSITWEMPTRDSFGSPKPGRRLLCVRREVNSLLKLDWLDWRSRQAVWGFVGCWLWCLCSRNNPAPEPTQLALQLQQWLLVDDTTEYLSHVGSFLRRREQMPFCPRQGTKTHQRNDSIQVAFREPRNYQSDLQVHEGSLTYKSMGD